MKQIGVHRRVVEWKIVNSPRGKPVFHRTLTCGHVTFKRFSPMDRHEYNTIGQPFRRPRFAFCLQCTQEAR